MIKKAILVSLLIMLALSLNSSADIVIGRTLLKQKKYSEARAEFEKDLPGLKGKDAASLLLMIASTYQLEKKFKEARQEYEKALQAEGVTDVQKSQALLEIGNTLWRNENDTEGSRQAFSKVLELKDAGGTYKGRAQMGLATAYWIDKNSAATIREAEKVLSMEGADASTRTMAFLYLGRGYKAEKKYAEAIKSYREFETRDKRINYVTEARLAIGEILIEESSLGEARELLSGIISDEKAPANYRSSAHMLIAKSYLSEKKNEEALTELKKLAEAPYATVKDKREAEKNIKQLEKK